MENKNEEKETLPLSARSYVFIAIGFLLIIVGFALMTGGTETTATHFDESIFSFRRITLAPIIVVIGFATVFFGIIRKPRKKIN